MTEDSFDVILVGSGTCGATIARELARLKKRVLILEQGADRSFKDTIAGMLAVGRVCSVGDGLQAMTAVTVGGSTSLYFGVCGVPSAETFATLGIDLSEELAQVEQELPIGELPDEFLQPQSILVRDSARELGYPFRKSLMLIDQSRCFEGNYSYDAKWKVRSYLAEAIYKGATLISGAAVSRVIIESGRAVGVEYKQSKRLLGSKVCTAYGKKIVLCAGALATPKLLIDCGVKNVGDRGFFVKPAFMVFGIVPGLKARDAFIGNLNLELDNGISIGDAAMNSSLFKLFMLANFKWRHLFSHSNAISVGVQLNDGMSGQIGRDGRYSKQLTQEEVGKLKAGEQIAVKILERAGARDISSTRLAAGIPGGALRIHEHLDGNLQTGITDLYVCDHSVMSDVKITPTVTLICLARRLAKHLAGQAVSPVRRQAVEEERAALPA
jgi:choline dehydrogenase-like flavoprotein